eukprot:750756-Hanusia_phi.AAC.1
MPQDGTPGVKKGDNRGGVVGLFWGEIGHVAMAADVGDGDGDGDDDGDGVGDGDGWNSLLWEITRDVQLAFLLRLSPPAFVRAHNTAAPHPTQDGSPHHSYQNFVMLAGVVLAGSFVHLHDVICAAAAASAEPGAIGNPVACSDMQCCDEVRAATACADRFVSSPCPVLSGLLLLALHVADLRRR